jgi:hypothetical protein
MRSIRRLSVGAALLLVSVTWMGKLMGTLTPALMNAVNATLLLRLVL